MFGYRQVLPTGYRYDVTDYVRPFTDNEIIALGIVLGVLCLFGIFLNILTIVVIGVSRELNTGYLKIIVALCCSDLISAIISPFIWYRDTLGYDQFSPLPSVFCKLMWGFDILTSQATALMITMLAIIRYIAIQFPLSYKNVTVYIVRISLVAIWVVCIGCGFVPMVYYMEVKTKNRSDAAPWSKWPACSVDTNKLPSFAKFMNISTPIFFYTPTAIVIVCSVLIAGTICLKRVTLVKSGAVKNVSKERTKREAYVAKQLLLIVLCFLVGYIPFTAYSFWTVYGNHSNSPSAHRFDYWFSMSAYLCTRISECLNPIIYNIGSKKIRKETLTFLRPQANRSRASSYTPTGLTKNTGAGISWSGSNNNV